MKPLTARQSRFVNAYVAGMSAAEAARQAGYKAAYAQKAARDILTHPTVAATIQELRMDLTKKTQYDLEAAVAETDKWIAMIEASASPNFMAASRLIQHKAELHGLLIQRVEVKPSVDIRDALAAARARVAAHVVNVPALPSDSPLD